MAATSHNRHSEHFLKVGHADQGSSSGSQRCAGVVLGDEDGLVTFDRADAQDLLSLVHKQQAREADALAAIAEGRLDDPYIGIEKAL